MCTVLSPALYEHCTVAAGATFLRKSAPVAEESVTASTASSAGETAPVRPAARPAVAMSYATGHVVPAEPVATLILVTSPETVSDDPVAVPRGCAGAGFDAVGVEEPQAANDNEAISNERAAGVPRWFVMAANDTNTVQR